MWIFYFSEEKMLRFKKETGTLLRNTFFEIVNLSEYEMKNCQVFQCSLFRTILFETLKHDETMSSCIQYGIV